jgi:hypothetical protein
MLVNRLSPFRTVGTICLCAAVLFLYAAQPAFSSGTVSCGCYTEEFVDEVSDGGSCPSWTSSGCGGGLYTVSAYYKCGSTESGGKTGCEFTSQYIGVYYGCTEVLDWPAFVECLVGNALCLTECAACILVPNPETCAACLVDCIDLAQWCDASEYNVCEKDTEGQQVSRKKFSSLVGDDC